jgi:hypothetical protein
VTAKFKTWLFAAAAVLALTGLPLVAQSDNDPENARYIGEGAKDAEACVEDTDLMRRDHMLLLLKQRDLTVHEGIRTKKHSLTNCISCHAKKDAEGAWIPPTTREHFCQGCHVYTGTKIDCFECHAGQP